jgi:DNA helicase-2/ATP-dependent DNA helicase PcrA
VASQRPARSARSTAVAGADWQQPAAANALRIGQNVRHARFGVGVIVSSEGAGPEARVQVNFGAGGMKWLALEYAKLTPA